MQNGKKRQNKSAQHAPGEWRVLILDLMCAVDG